MINLYEISVYFNEMRLVLNTWVKVLRNSGFRQIILASDLFSGYLIKDI